MSVMAQATYPGSRSAAAFLTLLILIMMLGYIDRQIIVFLIDPIKASFALSDTQIGLVQGFSATLFIAITALPFGWALDRWNRRNILACCMVGWACMTVLTGLARNFEQFFLTRVGLGIAEACLYPAAISLVADLFPPEKRATANLFMIGGANVTIMAAFTTCGLLVDHVQDVAAFLPFLPADLAPWRLSFIIVALPVPLAAILLMLMREPSRQGYATKETGRRETNDFLPHLIREWRILILYPFALGLAVLALDGVLQWLPTALSRGFGMQAGDIGSRIGTAAAAGALLAPFLANFAYRKLKARRQTAPEIRVMAGATAFALLPVALLAIIQSPVYAVSAFALLGLSICVTTSYNFYVLQKVVPGSLRGRFTAFAIIVRTLLTGGGVWMIGYLSDHYFPTGTGLLTSMTAVATCSLILSVGVFVYVLKVGRIQTT